MKRDEFVVTLVLTGEEKKFKERFHKPFSSVVGLFKRHFLGTPS